MMKIKIGADFVQIKILKLKFEMKRKLLQTQQIKEKFSQIANWRKKKIISATDILMDNL